MADDAGETMLTEERLAEIEKREPHIEVAGIVRGGYVIRELLDHITTLSTTIKRLETPVAEGEVEELGQLEKAATPGPWFRQDWGGEAYVCANDPDEPSRVKGIFGLTGEADCALTTALRNKALSICRRQAREIERLKAALEVVYPFVAVMFGQGPTAEIPETVTAPIGVLIKLGDIMRQVEAALSLNSVETREMNP